jgi:hypothetical protein
MAHGEQAGKEASNGMRASFSFARPWMQGHILQARTLNAQALGALHRVHSKGSAARWSAWQWSGNRDRTLTAFMERAEKEAAQRPALAEVYHASATWVAQGEHPRFKPTR